MSEPFPAPVFPLMVWLKRAWTDEWQFQPECVVRGLELASGNHGDCTCELWRPYGPEIAQPWQSAMGAEQPWREMAAAWVKVSMVYQTTRLPREPYAGNCLPMFYGRVASENNTVHGADRGQSGEQSWQCVGPRELLRRVSVSQSVWEVYGSVRTVGWTPRTNDRENRQTSGGNRSLFKVAGTGGQSFVFGGAYTWDNLSVLEYLLNRFVNAADGPVWTIGGQDAELAKLHTDLDFGATRTVGDILDELIPRSAGLDYLINATEQGFEIRVFSLNSRLWSFAGETLHYNPHRVELRTGVSCYASNIQVATSWQECYGRIRVIGERIVVCTSLVGQRVGDAVPLPAPGAFSLDGKWLIVDQVDYCGGFPGMMPPSAVAQDVHDEYRQQPRFRNVFASYGAPAVWDLAGAGLVPMPDDLGYVAFDGAEADCQDNIRSTLTWTPLLEDWDYYYDGLPPKSMSGGYDRDLLPPIVYVGHIDPKDPFNADAKTWTRSEALGMGVEVLKTNWGFSLSADPNHILAKAYEAAFNLQNTNTLPQYYGEDLVVTLAFQADQRLSLTWDPYGLSPGVAGVKDIYVAGAECWVMGPQTVVGLDDDGHFNLIANGMELRNDRDRLLSIMCGALARYGSPRSRVSLTVEGLLPWAALVGRILVVLDSDGESQGVEAPVTSISWQIPDDAAGTPRTIVKTGYAD